MKKAARVKTQKRLEKIKRQLKWYNKDTEQVKPTNFSPSDYPWASIPIIELASLLGTCQVAVKDDISLFRDVNLWCHLTSRASLLGKWGVPFKTMPVCLKSRLSCARLLCDWIGEKDWCTWFFCKYSELQSGTGTLKVGGKEIPYEVHSCTGLAVLAEFSLQSETEIAWRWSELPARMQARMERCSDLATNANMRSESVQH